MNGLAALLNRFANAVAIRNCYNNLQYSTQRIPGAVRPQSLAAPAF